MPVWAYILHCDGGSLYTDHTDDLDRRVENHHRGLVPGHAQFRLPVSLVWSQEFASQPEARRAEAEIKGWPHDRKLALIRGDAAQVASLAKHLAGPAPPPKHQGEISGEITAKARLDKALADATDLSRARVQALIADGHVVVGGRVAASPSAKIAAGTTFVITIPPPEPLAAQPQDIAVDVVYEDAHLIVVNKPAGMVVHPGAGNPDGTLVNALLNHCRGTLSGIGGVARPGIVHRIDKDTSGLLVVAKSDAAHEGLARQFADHSLTRAYIALVSGHPVPSAGTIETRLGRSDGNRTKMAVLPPGSSRGKHAITHYRTSKSFGAESTSAAMLECRLETGRTHQVRVHCASIGHPLLGDPAYGSIPSSLRKLLKELSFSRQALHARELGFVHPVTGDRLHFTCDLPPDMAELIDRLSGSD